MKVLSIPKNLAKLAKDRDLVILPREKYEKLLHQQVAFPAPKKVREFTPTAAERRDLRAARKDFERGNYLTIDELKRKLGFKG